jgi:hypothetical protein
MSTDSQERKSPRLLDQVREPIRIQHYTSAPSRPMCNGSGDSFLFHDKRHPLELGAGEVTAFLSHLAVKRNVAASTQNQALNAILFLCRDVLKCTLPWLEGVLRSGACVSHVACGALWGLMRGLRGALEGANA